LREKLRDEIALLVVHIVSPIPKTIGLKLLENHGMNYKSYILA